MAKYWWIEGSAVYHKATDCPSNFVLHSPNTWEVKTGNLRQARGKQIRVAYRRVNLPLDGTTGPLKYEVRYQRRPCRKCGKGK